MLQALVKGARGFSTAANDEARKVAFCGLGNMGSRMAANLMKGGVSCVVYDQSVQALERLCEAGAEAASSPAQLASTPGVDVLITMLPSSEHVEEVYCGSNGVLAAEGGVRPSLLVDCSTIDPPTAQRVAQAAHQTTLHRLARPFSGCSVGSPTMIDAPVSGGVTGAQAATLTFMCGGEEAAFKAAEPFLKLMGKRTVHCGGPGSGQAAKVCNNLVLAVSMAGVAEGLALGVRLGLDPKLLSNIFNTSSARCWSSDSYNPCPGVMEGVPAARGYQGGFGAGLMVKDVGLAAAAAAHCGARLPMGERALELYQQLAARDGGTKLDFGAIYKHIYMEDSSD